MRRGVAVLASAVSAVALLILGSRVIAPDDAGEQRVQTASARPNIVFVMTDDMPEGLWKSMPTPKGRVSVEGTRFTDAYVTQSLCCPSRATALTGEYPHNHGITGNAAPNGGEAEFRSTGQDQDTIATRMQAEGYRTALIGKYMNGYKGDYVPPGWSYWYTESGKNGINDNGHHGVVRTQLVANNDLAPTFATWAGLPPPEEADGRSIASLLSAAPPSTWRTALLNESRYVRPEDQTSPNYEAIFTASGERYVEYATDEKELYDLETDPYELTNSYDADAPPTGLTSRLQALEKCAGETCRKAENGPQN